MALVLLRFRRSLFYNHSRVLSSQVALKCSKPHQQPSTTPEAVETEGPSYEIHERTQEEIDAEQRGLDRGRLLRQSLKDVTVVRTPQDAARVLEILTSEDLRHEFHAWDTETTGIDPKNESPVGRGQVICATAFCGSDIDFGNGPKLFVDNLDDAQGTLDCFKGYFANEKFKKVWHNYSFDRHVLWNHGIAIKGFGGDTMHMARLLDTSRISYSLKALCECYLGESSGKSDMKESFGKPRILKSGEKSKKEIVVPKTLSLHRSNETAADWIKYATMDAKLTFDLREKLHRRLEQRAVNGTNAPGGAKCKNLYELYYTFFLEYGELLADMEHHGMCIDISRLKRAQALAEADREVLEKKFRDWACTFSKEAKYMNVNSDKQKQHILFSPYVNKKTGEELSKEKVFKMEKHLYYPCPDATDEEKAKKKKPILKKEMTLVGKKLKCAVTTASGWPSVSASSLKLLAGSPRANPPIYGYAGDAEACRAIDALIEASAVSTLLSSFINPLQEWPDENGRIHASLNLNTETGRLSSRRPNLQNQPALEKDRYKIRDAFVAGPGNALIVADYGQLELRLLAHITNCKSMIEAFEAGGDFHSRTASTMYPEIQTALAKGDCVLEGDGTGTDTVPLVKEKFATERRRAKTLNFSIAYGKTQAGLARDWGISTEEAKETLELWYKERQEVRQWQEECRGAAWHDKFVETITGRRRDLPMIRSKERKQRYHAERAAINAPLQGSAADVVMAAMLDLHKDDSLNVLGWKIVLQVHDEIILEGPKGSADQARESIQSIMQSPSRIHLRVALDVDPSIAETWYAAK